MGHILTSCPNSLFQLISERHDEVVELVARAVLGQLGVGWYIVYVMSIVIS